MEKVLYDWKAHDKKNSKTLAKRVFPAILAQLLAAHYHHSVAQSMNLESEFTMRGNHPFDRVGVLNQRLGHKASKDHQSFGYCVGNAKITERSEGEQAKEETKEVEHYLSQKC